MSQKNLTELVALEVDDFIKELVAVEAIDEKIEKMLGYMKLQLSHGEIHPLSRFWKMRKFCLDHFKSSIPVSKRVALWKDYCQVIDEIVKLKEIIDEKSSFDCEQIEQALASIDAGLEKMDQLVLQESDILIPKCYCLQKNAPIYKDTQKELNIYTSYAKQLNGLKKEILALDISFKLKQQILDRIYALSDKVFPAKRDLLNLMSKTYSEDVRTFVKNNFASEELKYPAFQLKEQIKQLQNFAKVISLNVEAFSATREMLSECWDKVKVYEKEQKKVKEEKKQELVETAATHAAPVEEKAPSKKKSNALKSDVENQKEFKSQRKETSERAPFESTSRKQESSSKADADPYYQQLQSEALQINENVKYWDYQTIDSKLKNLLNHCDLNKLSDTHRLKFERMIFSVKEALAHKLSDEINERIDIEEISEQIQNFRMLLKNDIELYRKTLSQSNQSIEKAIVFNELLVQTRGLINSLDNHLNKHKAERSL